MQFADCILWKNVRGIQNRKVYVEKHLPNLFQKGISLKKDAKIIFLLKKINS